MKITVLTLGCKVNQAESTFIEGNLLDLGCSIVELSEHPDYCVINTCSVTAKSDYQSRQLIRRAVRAGAKVIVTGCYSELRPEEIRRIAGNVDIVRNNDKYNIINMLSIRTKSNCSVFSARSRPYLKIQDGCNSACSYCVVPKARGRSRSLAVSEIIDQVLRLESCGYHEIVLTGIHLGSYGKDLKPKLKLSNIVGTILEKTNISRIRLSSIELNEIDGNIVELLREERICRHVHVPLQSGDDTILKRMNRSYTKEDYIRAIETVSRSVPEIAIGTDVIVGFPGEGEKEFLNTRNLLGTLPLAYIHIFPFSPRPDTVAFGMDNQVPYDIKKERFQEINALNNDKKFTYMSSQLDRTLGVVVEEQYNDEAAIGRSSNYLKIKVCSRKYQRKSLVYVRTAGIEGNLINGFPIEKS